MRMVAHACALAVAIVAGCYSAEPSPGAPCMPERANCPSGQTCELVAGAHRCITGAAPDGGPSVLVDAAGDADPARRWTLVQTRASMDQRRVTLSATGAGHLIVVAVETNATPATAVTDDAGNTYVPIEGSRAADPSEGLGIELWYAAGASAGAKTISAIADTIYAMVAWEVSGIRAASPLDAVTKLDDQPATTSPAGASIATSAAGDFIVSVTIVENTVSGLASGSAFTSDHTTYGNGWAHVTSAAAPADTYQARWNQPTIGSSCAASAAFFAAP
jgi:hypothetical protein